jgi:hypothetical protein
VTLDELGKVPNQAFQLTAAAFGFSSAGRQMTVFGLSHTFLELPPQLQS